MLLIAGAFLVWFAYDEYQRTMEQEIHFMEAHVRVADASLTGLLHNVDRMLQRLAAERLATTPRHIAELEASLSNGKRDFPEMVTLFVTDAGGHIEMSSDPSVKGFDASAREYFKAHAGRGPGPSLFISRPFIAVIGNNSIVVSKPIIDSEQRFRGVVGAGFDPRIFDSLLRSVRPDEAGSATTLFNQQGDVIYRLSDLESDIGKNVAGGKPFQEYVRSGASSFYYIGDSAIDGVKRLYVFRRIGDSGLSLNVSCRIDDVFAQWRRNLTWRMIRLFVIAALLLCMIWIVRGRQREARAAKASADQSIESDLRYRSLFENMLDGFAYCRMRYENGEPSDFIYLDVNNAFEPLTGLKDVAGKWVSEVIPGIRQSDPELFELYGKVASTGFPEKVDRYVVALDMWFSISVYSPQREHFVAVFDVITKRKKAEEELQLAASIFNVSSEGMLVADAENRIVAINPAYAKMSGYTLEELVGEDPRIFKSGRHDRAFYQAMWYALETTGTWRGEIWDRNKDATVTAKYMIINTLYNTDRSVHRRVVFCSDITEKKQAEETIWRQANFDALTGLPNRRLFHDRLEQEINKTQRSDQALAVLFIDLDHFKEINDTRGHALGDMLLVEAARRINSCVRVTDTLARLGGDEFTVVLPGLDDLGRADRVAQSIVDALAKPFTLRGEDLYVSASIGITLYPHDAVDIDALLKNADQAMYVAKENGRNGFSYFIASMQHAAQDRQHLIHDLRTALSSGQLEVYFQPIIELATGQIHKAEALLRWHHPLRGMVSPALFIPLAEETGLIHEIGDWVFRESVRFAKRWLNARCDATPVQISVNKSPRQFVGGNTHQDWIEYLTAIGLPANCIAIEITEGLLLDARSEVIEKLRKFRACGIQISLDDFGTGYSAMAYLKKFHLDYLKIDQSFVRDMQHDPGDQAIVEAIIVMAHKLGLRVIAEGVETPEQRALLTAAGCHYAQGYLFARPMPALEFEALLNRQLHSNRASDTPHGDDYETAQRS